MQHSENAKSETRDDLVAAKLKEIKNFDDSYPDPAKKFSYGTAGFRDKADVLERAFYRVGLVVAIRAK